MATKKAKATEVEQDIEQEIEEEVSSGTTKFDVRAFYQQSIDEVSMRQGVDADPMEDMEPMSSGWLALDIIYGGGLRPGMVYTHAGEEQTAKTTLALTEMAQAVHNAVPLIAFWDYEGSTRNSKPYIAGILKTAGIKLDIKDLFGQKHPETGKWVKRPIVQYYAESIAEKFFDWLAAIERDYPDKRYIPQTKKWWLIYADNKVNKAKIGSAHNPKMKKYGKGLWVEAPDGNLQGFIINDSWAAMNPEANDGEETNDSLALQARMFAKQWPRVKGRMQKKMITIVGTNQLSDIPMAMYGPKQQEPGGKRLRFFSDCRTWNIARASGMPFNPEFDKEEGHELEKSVTGKGYDSYRYVQCKNIKNKLSLPKRKMWMRIWVEDAEGTARGFDPFFDTMVYLRETGQMKGNERKKLTLNIQGMGEAKKPATWIQLKQWVLGTKEQKQQVCKELGFEKAFDLRMYCFKQMKSGKSEQLYIEHRDTLRKV